MRDRLAGHAFGQRHLDRQGVLVRGHRPGILRGLVRGEADRAAARGVSDAADEVLGLDLAGQGARGRRAAGEEALLVGVVGGGEVHLAADVVDLLDRPGVVDPEVLDGGGAGAGRARLAGVVGVLGLLALRLLGPVGLLVLGAPGTLGGLGILRLLGRWGVLLGVVLRLLGRALLLVGLLDGRGLLGGGRLLGAPAGGEARDQQRCRGGGECATDGVHGDPPRIDVHGPAPSPPS